MTHGADVLIAGVGISHAAGADQQALAVHGVHDLMDVGLHAGGSFVGLGTAAGGQRQGKDQCKRGAEQSFQVISIK